MKSCNNLGYSSRKQAISSDFAYKNLLYQQIKDNKSDSNFLGHVTGNKQFFVKDLIQFIYINKKNITNIYITVEVFMMPSI